MKLPANPWQCVDLHAFLIGSPLSLINCQVGCLLAPSMKICFSFQMSQVTKTKRACWPGVSPFELQQCQKQVWQMTCRGSVFLLSSCQATFWRSPLPSVGAGKQFLQSGAICSEGSCGYKQNLGACLREELLMMQESMLLPHTCTPSMHGPWILFPGAIQPFSLILVSAALMRTHTLMCHKDLNS